MNFVNEPIVKNARRELGKDEHAQAMLKYAESKPIYIWIWSLYTAPPSCSDAILTWFPPH